jgi:hypothetical protein
MPLDFDLHHGGCFLKRSFEGSRTSWIYWGQGWGETFRVSHTTPSQAADDGELQGDESVGERYVGCRPHGRTKGYGTDRGREKD